MDDTAWIRLTILDWIRVAQDMFQEVASVKQLLKLRIPDNTGNFLIDKLSAFQELFVLKLVY
jgi:hypothetical protein